MSKSRKILLIDYDPESIQSTRDPLKAAGFDVEVASDGVAGLEAFRRLKPDLVVIEPMVPKKHGFQVCREIKSSAAGKTTPVLITTAFYRGRKHRNEAQKKYGADAYLEKPIAAELLLSTCRGFLIDTQVPPIPPSHDAEPLAVGPQPVPPRPAPALVTSLPDLPISEEARPSPGLALDDLSEDEIAARLDALIIEEAEDPALEAAASPVPLAAAAATAASAPPTVPAAQQTAPITSTGEAPPPAAPRPMPVAVPGKARRAAAPVPSKKAAKPEETAAPPARAGWPIWVGLAAGALILAGVGILWLIGDGGASTTEPSPGRVARRSATPPATPVRTSTPMPLGATDLAESRSDPAATGAAATVPTDEPASADTIDLLPAAPDGSAAGGPVATEAAPRAVPSRPVAATPPAPAPTPRAATPTATRPAEGSVPDQPEPRSPRPAKATAPVEPPDGPARGASPPGTSAATPPAVGAAPAAEGAGATASAVGSAGSAEGVDPTAPAEVAETSAAPSAPEVRLGELVDVAELDQPPVALDKRMPDYPPGARAQRIEGTVNLRVLVNEHGRVERVEVESGTRSRQLQRAATEAAEDWTFEPPNKQGVAVKTWVPASVVFRI